MILIEVRKSCARDSFYSVSVPKDVRVTSDDDDLDFNPEDPATVQSIVDVVKSLCIQFSDRAEIGDEVWVDGLPYQLIDDFDFHDANRVQLNIDEENGSFDLLATIARTPVRH